MGSLTGTLKKHVRRLGFTIEFYNLMKKRGFKWCTYCKKWQPRPEFIRDVTRYDRLSAACRKGQNERNRATYASKRK